MPQHVAARLQQAIHDGVFAIGAQLPSQRELSEKFGVSRASLREAISMLATLGLVNIRPGLGVFINDPAARTPVWRLAHAASARDVYEARLAIEVTAAELAARRLGEMALARIAGHVDKIASALEQTDLVEMSMADAAFHDAIVEAAENPLIDAMYQSARKLMIETQRAPMATHQGLAETVAEHKVIFQALSTASAEASGKAMQKHILGSARRLGVPL